MGSVGGSVDLFKIEDGKLASVNSYGLTWGTDYPGDVDNFLNDSWGEFSGYVPTYIHYNFITASEAPEPAAWALMIGGFGFVGGAMRRHRKMAVALS